MTAHACVRLDDTHPLLHRSIQSARFVHCVPREQITNLLTSLLFRLKRLLTERIDNHIFSCQEAFPLLQRQQFNDKEQIVNKNKCMKVFVRLQFFFVPFLSGEKHHISYISQKIKNIINTTRCVYGPMKSVMSARTYCSSSLQCSK